MFKPPVPSTSVINDPKEALELLVNVAVALLSQCLEFCDQVDDRQHTYKSKLSPGATIGKHLRHLTDYYRPLIEACQSSETGKEIGLSLFSSPKVRKSDQKAYDKRSRGTPVESSVQGAKTELERLRKSLATLPTECSLGRKVKLEATTPFVLQVESTVGRELWFASLHAVHHLALIRVIATSELGLKVPSDFGVAPSTLVFKENKSKL